MLDYDLSLYLVTDRGYIGDRNLRDVVYQAVKGGVTMVQLREKEASTREFIELAQGLKKILQDKNVPLIINDRIDVALAVKADGVHLGQEDMPVELARKIMGDDYLIGLSIENMDQLRETENLHIDYIGLSPLFTTETKPELKHEWGFQGLRQAAGISSHKIVAIGNIDADNAAEVIKSGADGVAVVSAICASSDPEKAAKAIAQKIEKAK